MQIKCNQRSSGGVNLPAALETNDTHKGGIVMISYHLNRKDELAEPILNCLELWGGLWTSILA